MSNEDTAGQWIAELFQPAFSFAVDDVAALQEEGPIKSKIKRAPAFDPEAIQKVYEKVRVMNILDAEMKQQTWDREIAELTGEIRRRSRRRIRLYTQIPQMILILFWLMDHLFILFSAP